MQTGLVIWTTESQRRVFNSSSTDVAKHSTGVSRSRPWFFLSEADYQGMAAALRLKQLLGEFGIQQKHPIAIV